ncbi:MAG: HigA family addiction module antidote protein [Bacteroidales bacterium]|nr:HigA family addiction module antidote protein [Bacteroidales bacterium]
MITSNYIGIPVPHPGKVLQEKLLELNMSIKEFAARADVTEQFILDVITGASGVSPVLAIAIEFVTGMDAAALLKWQWQYDEWKARSEHFNKIAKAGSKWLKMLPVEEIVGNKWLTPAKGTSVETDDLLRFYGVASPNAWENYYFKQKLKVAFSISLEASINPYALSAWLRRGEIQAQEQEIENDYDAKKLKQMIPDLALILAFPQEDILTTIKCLFSKVGVKIIYTEPLSSVPIKGATRWIYGHPCIQLLNSPERYDNYAYTVLHETGHILLHGKKDIFIEEVGFKSSDPSYSSKEQEADAFARKWLAFGLQG